MKTRDEIREYNEINRGKKEAKKTIYGLNENEKNVFDLLVFSSAGNGHDFGCIEDLTEVEPLRRWNKTVKRTGLSKHQVAGYLSVLQKKKLVNIDPTEKFNLGENSATIFNLTDGAKDALYISRRDQNDAWIKGGLRRS